VQALAEAEGKLLHPRLIVCLGATAAAAPFGNKFRSTQDRGKVITHPWAPAALATIHPSAVLRIIDSDQRHAEYGRLVADLREAVKLSA
jgi:uracil-DNA glycosylase